jgi:uncharacterized protein (DUF2267 family)
MNTNIASLNPSAPILSESERTQSFLEKVKCRAGLEDIYDARDVAEVVFRTLRDLMTTESSDRVTEDLKASIVTGKTDDDSLIELWQDTNLLVRWLSRVRAPLSIDAETFLFRVRQESGLSQGIPPETAIAAVFAALKEELKPDRVEEIGSFLPVGIRQLWQRA